MRQVTLLEVVNRVLTQLNEKKLTSLSSTRTRDQQLVDAWNYAVQYLNSQGSFWWDEYFGTFITVDGKLSYEVTPYCSNYFPDSRGTGSLAGNNIVTVPKSAASYDDTYNLTKVTANGASPYIQKTSVGSLNGRRISASVWLMKDTSNDPGTITLTLTDDLGLQSVSQTITNDGTLKRYGISGYFDTSRSIVKLKVSWTSTTGVVWVDGWQVEDNDWPSENILNISTTAVQARTIFADPQRVFSIAPYKYNTQLSWNEILFRDENLYPFDHTITNDNITRYASLNGGQVNLENIEVGTHMVYRGKRVPPVYDQNTAGTEVVTIPEPELWTVIRGVIAYQKAAMYDSGQNGEVARAMNAFGASVADMVNSSKVNPSWSTVDIISPRMMR